MKRRPIVILAVSFAVVLAAGVALAQVGTFAPSFSDVAEETASADSVPPVKDPKVPVAEKASGDAEKTPEEEEPAREKPKDIELDEPAKPAEEPTEESAEEPADSTPPKLVITSPKDGAHFGENKLKYSGVTEPGARVFAGEWEADVFDNGEWQIVLILSPGKNITTFRAQDEAGNVAKATITAHLDVSEKEFSAHQKYGTNSDPWEKFSGTGPPGTVIELLSKYGNARMVSEGSEWYLKLHFEGLQEATSFPIVLEASTGHRMEFTFTYKPKAVGFSAHQKYGTNSDPWEKFYGTAMPGTVIELGSAYGSARLVTEGYEWYLKLHFEGLAGPASFPIVLHTSTGEVMDFSFTYDPKPLGFSAHQKYGSCSDPEPYDVFFGTATPGATITVTSDYGSGSVVAGEKGGWDLKVYFTGATPGQPFVVKVSDSEGHVKKFEFVSYTGGEK